jgi:hypothetical protein
LQKNASTNWWDGDAGSVEPQLRKDPSLTPSH